MGGVRVHATWLMVEGEAALWLRGRMVWHGQLGGRADGIDCDAVSISEYDKGKFMALLRGADAADIHRAIGAWWEAEELLAAE